MRPFFKLSALTFFALAAAITPTLAVSKHAACDITDNESDKAVLACTGSYTETGTADSIVFYAKDTVTPVWPMMSRLNRVPLCESGSCSYKKSGVPTVQSVWPDSVIFLVTGSIDTAKTVAYVVQVAATQPGNNIALWTTLSSTNLSFTTTRTVFRVASPYFPGMFFRTYAKTASAGGTTTTIIDNRDYTRK